MITRKTSPCTKARLIERKLCRLGYTHKITYNSHLDDYEVLICEKTKSIQKKGNFSYFVNSKSMMCTLDETDKIWCALASRKIRDFQKMMTRFNTIVKQRQDQIDYVTSEHRAYLKDKFTGMLNVLTGKKRQFSFQGKVV